MSRLPIFGGNKPTIKTTSTVTNRTATGGSRTTTTTQIRELLPCSAAQSKSRGGCQPCPSKSAGPQQARNDMIPSGRREIPRPGASRIQAPSSRMAPLGQGPAQEARAFAPGRAPGQFGAPSRPATGIPRCRGAIGGPSRAQRNELEEKRNREAAQELFNMSSAEVPMMEGQVGHQLLERSMANRGEKVYAKSQHLQQVQSKCVKTPGGMERLLQQTYSERRVERDDVMEKVVKNLAVTDMEGKGGTRVTISEQQLDPDYGLSSEGRDVVSVKETVSVTPSYTSTAKEVIHEVVKPKVEISPNELAKLVEEESQDVENTLKMVPPDLTFQEDRYASKKRLQRLRLNTESMILLEESVVNPTPTADDVLTETPPEALAKIMHTVENGAVLEGAPDQLFHTLFEEKSTEQSVVLSSIGPGPLQDVVVPQVLTKEIHKESMTPDLTDLTNIYKNVTDAKDWPPVDIFASVMDDEAKSPKKDIKSRPFKPLQDEEMPWADEDLEPLVNIVGAEPSAVLEPFNYLDLETSGNLETELAHGIEYFVDADPVQYMSRVQMRGSQPPPWFPGYIYALPEFPDVVKLARSPDEVFMSSWKSCRPKLMPDNSISVLH